MLQNLHISTATNLQLLDLYVAGARGFRGFRVFTFFPLLPSSVVPTY